MIVEGGDGGREPASSTHSSSPRPRVLATSMVAVTVQRRRLARQVGAGRYQGSAQPVDQGLHHGVRAHPDGHCPRVATNPQGKPSLWIREDEGDGAGARRYPPTGRPRRSTPGLRRLPPRNQHEHRFVRWPRFEGPELGHHLATRHSAQPVHGFRGIHHEPPAAEVLQDRLHVRIPRKYRPNVHESRPPHGAPRARTDSATSMSSGQVIFRFVGDAFTMTTSPPCLSTRAASSVAGQFSAMARW